MDKQQNLREIEKELKKTLPAGQSARSSREMAKRIYDNGQR